MSDAWGGPLWVGQGRGNSRHFGHRLNERWTPHGSSLEKQAKHLTMAKQLWYNPGFLDIFRNQNHNRTPSFPRVDLQLDYSPKGLNFFFSHTVVWAFVMDFPSCWVLFFGLLGPFLLCCVVFGLFSLVICLLCNSAVCYVFF